MTTTALEPAAPGITPRSGKDWSLYSACRGLDAEAFFSKDQEDKSIARRVCANCPVISECLTQYRSLEEGKDRWGIAGGLDSDQRIALDVEEVLGNRPNLAMARVLIAPRWSYRLRTLEAECQSLEEISAQLRADGLMVDAVTVRVAVWWLGGDGARITRVPESDTRSVRRQIREDYADVVLKLRDMGVALTAIAAYLGVPSSNGSKAVGAVARAAQAREAAA
ncbi:WhiB family transcriptional regulator [Streptomyces sp. NPDC005969]|uniref:WhiB family transcriptional regulator n=1 Tax=Streptomyces sp. NPDC005969 TaxID=3156722 RepID=UPI0034051628